MKRVVSLLAIFFFLQQSISAQIQNPVKWTATYKHISPTEGEIHVIAIIDKGWHTYSQKETKDGPIPTSFIFAENKQVEFIGTPTESEAHEEFVKAFDAKISVFTDKAEFVQKIKHKSKATDVIDFKVEFMSCNDLMCLPPKTLDLRVSIK